MIDVTMVGNEEEEETDVTLVSDDAFLKLGPLASYEFFHRCNNGF